jgi:hypothetical protein
MQAEKKGVNCFTPSLSIPLRKSYFFFEVFFAAFFFFAILSPPLIGSQQLRYPSRNPVGSVGLLSGHSGDWRAQHTEGTLDRWVETRCGFPDVR